MGKPINLQVHHIDGNKANNTLDNLQLLCPNCHSYTDNFGIHNKKQRENISDQEFVESLQNSHSVREALIKLGLSDAGGNYLKAKRIIDLYKVELLPTEKKEVLKTCPICGKNILASSSYCVDCSRIKSRKVENRPSREELKNLIRTTSFLKIGEMYDVSDNAIRKWCKAENLPYKKTEIKKISDED